MWRDRNFLEGTPCQPMRLAVSRVRTTTAQTLGQMQEVEPTHTISEPEPAKTAVMEDYSMPMTKYGEDRKCELEVE